jgi:hypothetical protein
VLITPSSEVVDVTGKLVLAASPIVAVLSAEGAISVTDLVCTDNTGLSPSGWNYQFNVAVAGASQVFSAYVPSAFAPSADITQLIP